MKYDEYMQSQRWREKRERALEWAEHRCQLCASGDRLEVHHNTYENLGHEKPADLIVLCTTCHGRFHDRPPRPREDDGDVDLEAFRRLSRAWARSHVPSDAVLEARRRRVRLLYDVMIADDTESLRIQAIEDRAMAGDAQARADLIAMQKGMDATVRKLKGDAA